MVAAEHAGAILDIDLDAIAANFGRLRARLAGAECAAVVKADAYGLGLGPVAARLAREGCRRFFVAHLDEAIALRAVLAPLADEAAVYVLNGLIPGAARDFARHRAVPVLNSPAEIEAWSAFARARERRMAAIVNVDTGMSRLGLEGAELAALAAAPERLAGIAVAFVMSHLACAEAADEAMNEAQRTAFVAARRALPPAPATLANSAGIFLGPPYHFDLVRPGAALFGLAPRPNAPNPMAQVISLQGKILQVRDVDRGRTVGYGATHRITRPRRLATVAVGYGDGYPRSLSNRGSGFIGDIRVPVVGRVSMDLVTFDVTDVPAGDCRPGAAVELVGARHDADALAAEAGTIGYEILTALGRRYYRRYRGGA